MSALSPVLATQQIKDPLLRRNFQNLASYFASNGQLDGFIFMEQIFTQAQKHFQPAHNLGLIPTDIILCRLTGPGSVTFNFGLFTTKLLDITVTGACRVRFFFGVQGGQPPSTNSQPTDAQTYGPPAPPPPPVSTTTPPVPPCPTGSLILWTNPAPPAGWLVSDGSAVSRSTYAALFGVIGITFGSGDGSTTFNLPNTQGVFVRGVGSQSISGVSYSGTLGASESDQMQGHQHGTSESPHSHSIVELVSVVTIATSSGATAVDAGTQSTQTGTSVTGLTVTTPTSDGTHGTPRTGAQTQPANIALYYIIKT